MKFVRHPFVPYLILLVCFSAWAINQSFATYHSQVAACERGNINRQDQLELVQDLVDVNKRRVKAASSEAEAQANAYAVRQYAKDRDTLIRSQADVAEEPGSVVVDCEAAYPRPSVLP